MGTRSRVMAALFQTAVTGNSALPSRPDTCRDGPGKSPLRPRGLLHATGTVLSCAFPYVVRHTMNVLAPASRSTPHSQKDPTGSTLRQ